MGCNCNNDDLRVVKTGAWSGGPGCHGGCGVELHIKDGKPVTEYTIGAAQL